MKERNGNKKEAEVGDEDLQLRVRKIDNGYMVLTRGSQRYCEDIVEAVRQVTHLIKRRFGND